MTKRKATTEIFMDYYEINGQQYREYDAPRPIRFPLKDSFNSKLDFNYLENEEDKEITDYPESDTTPEQENELDYGITETNFDENREETSSSFASTTEDSFESDTDKDKTNNTTDTDNEMEIDENSKEIEQNTDETMDMPIVMKDD